MTKTNFIEIYDGLDVETCELIIEEFEHASKTKQTESAVTCGIILEKVRNSEDYYYYRMDKDIEE